jgi:predicted acetyltransferase
VYKHVDFNKEFFVNHTNSIDLNLEKNFYNEMSLIDKKLIDYYKTLNFKIQQFYTISCEDILIGYAKTFYEKKYIFLSEIYIVNEFRNLGLATFLLQCIRKDVKNIDSFLRTATLPSDRTAKNFYEANGITARVLLMEEKRDKYSNRS